MASPHETYGEASENCSDTLISSIVFTVPALLTAVANRLTVQLASRRKAAKIYYGLVSWLTHSPTRLKMLLFLVAVSAFLSYDVNPLDEFQPMRIPVRLEKEDDDFSMNITSDITD